MSLPDFAIQNLPVPELDRDELEIDLLAIGIGPHMIPDTIDVMEMHALPLAAEAFRRLIQRWQDSNIPRLAGLVRALDLHGGESLREAAARCGCSSSTIAEHEHRFRESDENRSPAS